jgi:hypothetical protein
MRIVRSKREMEKARNVPSSSAERCGGANEKRVAEPLPDRECLLRRLPAQRRVDAAESENLRIVVERRGMRHPVRRPGPPLTGVLERGRDHPEDRKDDQDGPRQQDVPHSPMDALAAQPACSRLLGRQGRAQAVIALRSLTSRSPESPRYGFRSHSLIANGR